MTRTSTQLVRLDSLQPHPENKKIYNDAIRSDVENEELLTSICNHGLWEGQLQIHPSMTILHGHRRVELALELGIEEAVVTIRHDLPEDPLDAEVVQFLLNGNAQREKTQVERLREFEVRKTVEAVLAKRRMVTNPHAVSGYGHGGHTQKEGTSRDLAAKKAGLGGSGSRAEAALKALKKADELELTAPEKAKAIKQSLNQSLSTGIRTAKALTASPVEAPAYHRTKEVQPKEPIGPTMQFVSSVKSSAGTSTVEGKRIRNIHRCRKLDGFKAELEYMQREMPKMLERARAAERQMRKMGDHLREGFVQDRNYAQFMTIWATAWKEDGTYDFLADLETLSAEMGKLQGALTGFQRFAFTEDVLIDREEP